MNLDSSRVEDAIALHREGFLPDDAYNFFMRMKANVITKTYEELTSDVFDNSDNIPEDVATNDNLGPVLK